MIEPMSKIRIKTTGHCSKINRMIKSLLLTSLWEEREAEADHFKKTMGNTRALTKVLRSTLIIKTMTSIKNMKICIILAMIKETIGTRAMKSREIKIGTQEHTIMISMVIMILIMLGRWTKVTAMLVSIFWPRRKDMCRGSIRNPMDFQIPLEGIGQISGVADPCAKNPKTSKSLIHHLRI